MPTVPAYAAHSKSAPLTPFLAPRREVGPRDVLIDIAYCGVCHSDIHQVRDEWGGAAFPMVPGHEIVGRVGRVGREVTRFRAGDVAGVGCFVDSCRTCGTCRRGLEQFCEKGPAFTYNSTEMDRKTPTYGGYSTQIVVDEAYTLRIPPQLDLAGAAPLLCAGITTYAPLRRFQVRKGTRVGVVGLGGLGHMAVKIAAAMGAEVTMLSTSRSKEQDARRLGAQAFVLTTDPAALDRLRGTFDLIIDSVSAPHDVERYLRALRVEGAMAVVGLPPSAVPIPLSGLVQGNKTLAGSMIGGITLTQEMLDFCGSHGIVSEVEVIPAQRIDEAYQRTVSNDVRYRFVIDAATIRT
ncbi:MAG TPA: NAD(P)-dependent alcohol dehydrogenase [Anaeromyxobacter sp.]|nr:NAD(P)-dependent alcohol dehydrogenase [Anaeromyxobacter sp.]